LPAQFLFLVGTVFGLSLLFRLIERLWPAQQGQKLSGWLFNLAYSPFILGFAFILGPALAAVAMFVSERTGGGLLPTIGAASWPGQLLFTLAYAFAWDLWQYAMHRLQHRSAFLWETHRFHHDETQVNAATQTRVHAASYLLGFAFHLPVVILFGLKAPPAIAGFLMFTLWGFVNHSNLRLPLGPLTPLVAGPQWHRIHHSVLPEHRDRNFAVLFPAIDMMFGTYYRPAWDEYPPTGLGGPPVKGIEAATYGPFIAWGRMARAAIRRG
jgi:sterol desaturase/sphingolipid hydroxylase (fatty acid hydroxylase superfamily)